MYFQIIRKKLWIIPYERHNFFKFYFSSLFLKIPLNRQHNMRIYRLNYVLVVLVVHRGEAALQYLGLKH
jgi:hypothetical protein